MNKLAKTVGFSSEVKPPESQKMFSPQSMPLIKASNSPMNSNFMPGINKVAKFASPKNDLFGESTFQDHAEAALQYRPDTGQGYNRIGGALRNNQYPSRPGTTGEGLGIRQPIGQRKDNISKGGFKMKKNISVFPTKPENPLVPTTEIDVPFETIKEEREAVEDLERWDSEVKNATNIKAVESEPKKDNHQVQYQTDPLEPYKTPALNREMMDLIDGNEDIVTLGRDGKAMTSGVTNMNKHKAKAPQKSIEVIMTEYNKKILNELLYNRVSKKLNIREGVSQNRLDLDFATKAETIDTIGNFKNLQQTIQSHPRIIEYDALYQKLTVQRKLPDKIFQLDEDRKKLHDAESDFASIETSLKVQFEAVIAEVHKKKEMLNELRLSVQQNNDKIKDIEEEIDDLTKKYEAIEYQYNQAREQSKNMNRTNNTRNKRGGVRENARQAVFVEEYSKYQRQLEEKKEQIRELREEIEGIETETHKCQQKSSGLEMEIKELKAKKNQLRRQLKHIYHQIIKNEEHIFNNEASFITIIKNLWKIHEEIVEDMFPSFVDRDSLVYLVENARLEFELEQLEQMAKSEDIKDPGLNDYQYGEDLHNRVLKAQKSIKAPLSEQLADVRNRLNILKKGIVRIKRPVFIKDGPSKSRVIRWEELNIEADALGATQMNGHQMQEKVNQAIVTIKNKLAELKEREINRIFTLYMNKDIDEKNLNNLNKILISLFGRHDAEKTYQLFVRLKQAHDFKVSQNKTFVFASTKQFSNSVMTDKMKNAYILMLSNASNFKPNKPKSFLESELENNNSSKKKEAYNSFNKDISRYNEVESLEVNLNYNLNFNYASELRDKDLKSTFYLNKTISPRDIGGGLKSNLKDKDKMMQTTSSFNKVTFQEPVKPSRPETQSQPNFRRAINAI